MNLLSIIYLIASLVFICYIAYSIGYYRGFSFAQEKNTKRLK